MAMDWHSLKQSPKAIVFHGYRLAADAELACNLVASGLGRMGGGLRDTSCSVGFGGGESRVCVWRLLGNVVIGIIVGWSAGRRDGTRGS